MSLTDTYTLYNGAKIPQVGLGTWQLTGNEGYHSVLAALDAGYRHIDTAADYGNEKQVGQAIKDSGIPRENLFITTKLGNNDHGYEATKEAFGKSLENLGLDYVDLYLTHWPNPIMFRNNWQKNNAETWRAMEEFYDHGMAKAIGVSNFMPKHLDALLKTAKVKPMVNQIFVNPSDMQPATVEYNDDHDILTEAYSPLGTGGVFKIPELEPIARKYGKTPAQVVLRWSLQHGFLPLPKSVHEKHLKENADIFDFNLSSPDIKTINGFHGKFGLATDPDTVPW
ncbi:aldo/keto reductase [Lentilactobacillus kefiri]|uniref:Glyoxal reductase n=2 Tax=Lentilactobacillus kefiri TaxID=33962 RepID=A0A8E1RKJ8_LENKE|nr:aldo/keto reductase [Lentilactobacillus kefiri]KRL70011.1 glyoxal reductase [Lentilactobacillus parakefiri DSM 10551]KRM53971.1 glyoxal reductase [Lentilactobacillus kefiri DSM 20587 = JCM 5818]MCJ2160821.1 aldo/keto reductase [Lentilactobacillus kefiri]MCP9368440.1 aldo/keto reductase [Lentilactobacillus kefiri]MDH5109465.1 aldo/keto reductase [Lentilactobacillus kefiri]